MILEYPISQKFNTDPDIEEQEKKDSMNNKIDKTKKEDQYERGVRNG
ncbi:MAG: hypothetical protein PVI88_00065 [Nitrosopumilaceae archaeon]|jgi:hypothetical protein